MVIYLKGAAMRARLATIVIIAVALLAAVSSGTAAAASDITQTLTPGTVYEASFPVKCWNFGLVDGSNLKNVYINPPAVYAAPLANGSRSQYVSYAADLFDFTTGENHVGTFTAWALASTSTPAKLPQLVSSVPLFRRIGIRIHVIWWDPVSQRYSGTLDYSVNQYYDMDYIPWLLRSGSC